jgi:hypothetical protein
MPRLLRGEPGKSTGAVFGGEPRKSRIRTLVKAAPQSGARLRQMDQYSAGLQTRGTSGAAVRPATMAIANAG